jgi:hypothetical protein
LDELTGEEIVDKFRLGLEGLKLAAKATDAEIKP